MGAPGEIRFGVARIASSIVAPRVTSPQVGRTIHTIHASLTPINTKVDNTANQVAIKSFHSSAQFGQTENTVRSKALVKRDQLERAEPTAKKANTFVGLTLPSGILENAEQRRILEKFQEGRVKAKIKKENAELEHKEDVIEEFFTRRKESDFTIGTKQEPKKINRDLMVPEEKSKTLMVRQKEKSKTLMVAEEKPNKLMVAEEKPNKLMVAEEKPNKLMVRQKEKSKTLMVAEEKPNKLMVMEKPEKGSKVDKQTIKESEGKEVETEEQIVKKEEVKTKKPKEQEVEAKKQTEESFRDAFKNALKYTIAVGTGVGILETFLTMNSSQATNEDREIARLKCNSMIKEEIDKASHLTDKIIERAESRLKKEQETFDKVVKNFPEGKRKELIKKFDEEVNIIKTKLALLKDDYNVKLVYSALRETLANSDDEHAKALYLKFGKHLGLNVINNISSLMAAGIVLKTALVAASATKRVKLMERFVNHVTKMSENIPEFQKKLYLDIVSSLSADIMTAPLPKVEKVKDAFERVEVKEKVQGEKAKAEEKVVEKAEVGKAGGSKVTIKAEETAENAVGILKTICTSGYSVSEWAGKVPVKKELKDILAFSLANFGGSLARSVTTKAHMLTSEFSIPYTDEEGKLQSTPEEIIDRIKEQKEINLELKENISAVLDNLSTITIEASQAK